MILFFSSLTIAVLYVMALAHRVGIGRHPHARVWSRPRPLRLLAHGAHEARPAPKHGRTQAAASKAVAG